MTADLRSPIAPVLTPDDIVREVKHLPSAPKVLPRLKQLLLDGNSAMDEIVALVRLDPGIAARVLQVGNSTYFSQGIRCVTVDEAVHRVGYDQVYELVSYAVASQVLIRPLEVYAIEADELWKMSVTCALAAELLAERSGQDRNIAYTIGLLHCVGMVAIDEWALRRGQPLLLETTGFPREAVASERAQLGFTQAEAGGALLHAWQFPPSMAEPVRWQYTPRASAAYTRMTCLLYAAKWLRAAVCAPGCAPRPTPPEETYLQPLGLSAHALAGMIPVVQRRLGEISSLLEADTRQVDARRQLFPAAQWVG